MKNIVILIVIFMLNSLVYCAEPLAVEEISEQNRRIEDLMRENEKAVAEAEKNIPQESQEVQQKRSNLIEQAAKATLRKVSIKGQVVDLDGQAVSGAKVRYLLTVFHPLAPFFRNSSDGICLTDEKGFFEIKTSAYDIFIDTITCDGYDYMSELTYVDAIDFTNNTVKGPKSNGYKQYDEKSTEPYMYYMRKRGTTDYLLINDRAGAIFGKKENKPVYPQLLDTWIDQYGTQMDIKEGSPSRPVFDPDRCLEISCKFSDYYSEFDLVFKTMADDSGVIVTKDILYEAPESGYQSEVVYHDTMVAPNKLNTNGGRYGEKLYVFVQGPGKKFYSRIDMELTTTPAKTNREPQIRLGGYAYTNPLGRRYLEYVKTTNDNEKHFRQSLNFYRHDLELQAQKNREVFNVKEFKKIVDERYAGRNIEALKADMRVISEKNRKEREAQEEARLRARGLWSDDPAERERMKQKEMEESEVRFYQQREKNRIEAEQRAVEREQRRQAIAKEKAEKEAAKKAADEKAAQEQAK